MRLIAYLLLIVGAYFLWRKWGHPKLNEKGKIISSSISEVFWVLVISNLSVLVLSFVFVLSNKGQAMGFAVVSDRFGDSFKSGELFVYLCALLAPAIYMAAANFRVARHHALLGVLFLLQLIFLLASAIVYSLYHTGGLENIKFARELAISIYPLALLIWASTVFYKRLVIDKISGDISKSLSRQTRSRAGSIKAHLEGQEAPDA